MLALILGQDAPTADSHLWNVQASAIVGEHCET